jgi:hypothetical protein
VTAHEPVQGLPYPEPVDPPDGPNQIADLARALADRLVMRFASVAARDEALPAPVDGMECWTGTGSTAQRWYRVAGVWVETMPQGVWSQYNPTPTSGSGALGAATATCRWVRTGRTVQLSIASSITAAGTGAGALILPLPVSAQGQSYGIGRETQSTGVALTALAVGSQLQILRYDNASVIANGRTVRASITYEANAT